MSSHTERLIRAKTTKAMPEDELRDHIIEFLKTQNMCVLATCKDNVPRATPMEYYSKDLTLYMMPEEGQKLVNLRDNGLVSVGVFAPYTGWLSVRGVQISGEASLITREDVEEFREGVSVYQWQKSAREIGMQELPESFRLMKVEPYSIEMLDISMKAKGYAPRQIWTSVPASRS